MRDHPPVRLPRAALFAVSVLVCAWFVIGGLQAHAIVRATSLVAPGTAASRVKLAQATRELDPAAFLNPDREIDVLRARIAIAEGNAPRARRILNAVTRAEPLNLEAWIWLGGASLADPPSARIAARHIARLDPIDARQ
jgi:hypothetical protein